MNTNEIRPTYDYKYLQQMIAEKAGLVTQIKTNLVLGLEAIQKKGTFFWVFCCR